MYLYFGYHELSLRTVLLGTLFVVMENSSS